ncbi:hypothetical protein ACFL0V_01440 [Nanoarchaeota archaeon]
MELVITKKIAKQGKNLVLIIPKDLHGILEAGELVQIKFNKLRDKND